MQIYGIKSIISNFFLGFFFKLSPKQAICTIFIANSIKNYCCPIKVDRRNKIWLGYHFHGGRVCFFDFQAPSVEKRGLGRGIGCLAKENLPIYFKLIKPAI